MTADTIAGKYKIIREIARSNDVVYEAVDLEMGRRIALKELVIPPNLTGTARRERIERFHREARASGKLSHPNIVTVYSYGEDNGRYYIAMEYLEGGTLRDAIQSRGALPVQEAVEIASQILSALSHAHANRVIHRDVKPDNIHILPGGQVKLTDFGIARLTEEASLTGEGQVFGTPSYMSPEQIKGHHIDSRSDIFSVGIVLYEMIAGRKPFTGDSVISITYAIMEAEPPQLNGVSYGLESAIFRALNKDSIRRFGSADEMRQVIRSADLSPGAYNHTAGRSGVNLAAGPSAFPAPAPFGASPFPAGPMPFPSYGGAGSTAGAGGFGGSFGGGTFGGGSFGGGSVPSGQTGTAYAPPPVAAPPQTAGGPFVNWGSNNPNNPALAVPPPPFPRAAAGPVLSEGARTFFKALAIAILIGAIVLAGVLLFMNAYERQQQIGASAEVQQLVEQGKSLYRSGDIHGAIERFEEAMKRGPGSTEGDNARKSLIVAYNRLGLKAFEVKDFRSAETYWFKAYELDPKDEDSNHNLRKIYDRVGEKDQALQDWKLSRDGKVGDTNPAAPGSDERLQTRLDEANEMFRAAQQAFDRGDIDGARASWQKVIEKATGTPLAEQAAKKMSQLNEADTGNSPYLNP
jgi:eukaryotic-like serine/threonine-protein kinase